MIGSLLFLANRTRPDIATAVGILSQYTARPTKYLLNALNRVFGYLRGTVEYGIVFKKSNNLELVFYFDSDYAAERHQRKSRTRWIGLINGGPITWTSHKQHCTSTSTSEAECVALSSCSQEMESIRLVLAKIGEVSKTIYVRNDNTGAEAWANSTRSMRRKKHIDVRYNYIRQCIAGGHIATEHVDSPVNWADGFTKPLPREQFKAFVKNIGICQVENTTNPRRSVEQRNEMQ